MDGRPNPSFFSSPAVKERANHDFCFDPPFPTGTEPVSRARVPHVPRGLPVQAAYAAIDCAMVCLNGILVLYLQFGVLPFWALRGQVFGQATQHPFFALTYFSAALVVLTCASQDLYRTPRDRGTLEEGLMVAKAVGLATVLFVLFVFAFGLQGISRTAVLSLGLLNAITLSGWRYLKRRVILRRTLRGIGLCRVLIVGAGRTGRALSVCLEQNPQLGYKVCGFLDVRPTSNPQVLGTLADLRRVALEQFVDELFLAPPIDREVVKRLVLETRRLRLGLKVVPDLYDGLGWRAPVHAIGGFPMMQLHDEPIPRVGVAAKRVIDILMATAGLVLATPLLGVLAILVRLDSPGPSFYSAERVGYKGRRFPCWKLRTMFVGADDQKETLRKANGRNGPFFKIKNDPRITGCGRWLRKYSLDELPQLWNVLRGDMSMVGPRPHPVDDFLRYTVEHLRRLDVKPGLTGLWQVTARQDPSFETNLALDLEYIETWSLWLDLEILFRSLPEVLKGRGE